MRWNLMTGRRKQMFGLKIGDPGLEKMDVGFFVCELMDRGNWRHGNWLSLGRTLPAEMLF